MFNQSMKDKDEIASCVATVNIYISVHHLTRRFLKIVCRRQFKKIILHVLSWLQFNSLDQLKIPRLRTLDTTIRYSVIWRCLVRYLHCPLSVSQLTSGETTPGREQLHTSHPTTGWQPNVWGSHSMHSGRRVLGGQIQSPVTGSHNLEPQLQAGGQTGRHTDRQKERQTGTWGKSKEKVLILHSEMLHSCHYLTSCLTS